MGVNLDRTTYSYDSAANPPLVMTVTEEKSYANGDVYIDGDR